MSEWKLVPCEPTLEMCKAAAELTFSIAPSPRKIYITMLAAAPAAPAPERCPICKYQYGHQIECENNPVDQALKQAAPQNTDPQPDKDEIMRLADRAIDTCIYTLETIGAGAEDARRIVAARDEARAALRAAVEWLVRENALLHERHRKDNATLKRAEQEVAELRADAERYRWLRDVGDSNWTPLAVRNPLGWTAVDAAIDAMKETK